MGTMPNVPEHHLTQEPVDIGANGSIGKAMKDLFEATAYLDSSLQGLEEKVEPFLVPERPIQPPDKEPKAPPEALEHSQFFLSIREAIGDIYSIEERVNNIARRVER